jgi:hypothetical protein
MMSKMLSLVPLLVWVAPSQTPDPWAKVKAAPSGTELRIFKKNVQAPVLAKLDEASDENLIVVVKDTQVAIPKGDIDRIDYRPAQTGGRVTRETKTTKGVYDSGASGQGQPMAQGRTPLPPGTSSSSSSSLAIGGKPGFELLYRRPAVNSKPE